MRKLLAHACVLVVLLAVACGGSQASAQAQDHFLCCAMSTTLPLPARWAPCQWDACSNGSTENVYVYLYSASAQGQATVGVASSGQGVCFGASPDWCVAVDTSPDFVEDTSRPSAAFVPTTSAGLVFPPEYELCYTPTAEHCAGRINYGAMCCDSAAAIPPAAPPGSAFSSLPLTTPVETVPKPAGSFITPVPAMPRGMAIGMGASLLGLGIIMSKRR